MPESHTASLPQHGGLLHPRAATTNRFACYDILRTPRSQSMRYVTSITAGLAFAALLSAQTAEELVGKNLMAHGGVEKLKALHSLRMTGKMQNGGFSVQVGADSVAPNLSRQTFTLMGMTGISAYDGTIGW